MGMTRLFLLLDDFLSWPLRQECGVGRRAGDERRCLLAIDLRMNDAAWEGAAAIILDCVLGGDPVPGVSTRVLLTRDDVWLYIAARCADPSGKIRAEKTDRGDPGVANDDSLEFFLGTPSTKTQKEYRYFHFMLGAGNAAREQKIEKGRMDPAWTAAWPSATRVTDGGWEAEAALPLAILADGQLDGVVFNVTRNKQAPPARAYSWAVLEDGGGRAAYYNPAAFGRLTGLEDVAAPPMFAPVVLTAVNQGGYLEDHGSYSYAVSLSVTNTGDLAGTVEWTLEDRRLRDGVRMATSGGAELSARTGTNLIVHVPVDLPAARTAFIAVHPESAKRLEVGEMGRLCVLTAYTDRNMYHAGDSQGRLTVGTVFTDDAFARENLRLAVKLDGAENTRPLFERQFDATANQGLSVEFGPAELPPGDYVFTVELSRAGTVLAGETTRFRAAGAPPAGCAVTRMDQDNLCLLVNDRPFFPLGFCNLGGYGNVLAFDDQAQCVMETNLLERFRAGGFNTIVEWGRNQTGRTRARRHEPRTADTDKLLAEDIRAALADFGAAGRHGLMIMPKTIGRLSYGHSSETVNRRDHGLVMEKLPQVMQPLSGLTNLLAWQGMDEMFGGIYELGEAHAALMHNLAPFTAIWASTRGFFPELLDFYDVPGVHGYWGPDSTPNHLATRIQGGTATAKLRRRPVFATPQGQRLTYRRELTPDERRCGIYLTLIQGAKGIFWFTYPHPFEIVHPVTWRVLACTAREIGALAPVLLQNPPPQAVAETAVPPGGGLVLPPLPPARTRFDPSYAGGRGPGKDAMPRIQALIHDHPGGGELILLANSGDEPVLLEAALSSLAAALGESPARPPEVRGYFPAAGTIWWTASCGTAWSLYADRVAPSAVPAGSPARRWPWGWRAVLESAADVATRQYYQALDRRVNLGAAL